MNRCRLFTVQMAALLGGFSLLSAASGHAFAAQTEWLSPIEDGNYSQWSSFNPTGGGSYIHVDEAVGCSGSDTGPPGDGDYWFQGGAGTGGERQNVIIPLDSIPDGAEIVSVEIRVCHNKNFNVTGPNSGGGTFQTFLRLAGADIDSGVDIVTQTQPTNPARLEDTQMIPVGAAKGPSTDLTVGVVKTSTDISVVRIHTLAAKINYTVPAPVPTLSQWGLIVLAMITIMLAGYRIRRRKA